MTDQANTIVIETKEVYNLQHKVISICTTKYKVVHALVHKMSKCVWKTSSNKDTLLELQTNDDYYRDCELTVTRIAYYRDVKDEPLNLPTGV